MKKALSIVLVLCMAFALCASVFASGDPSGESGAQGAAITVTDGKMTLDEAYIAEHG